jgi:hypothetical protein
MTEPLFKQCICGIYIGKHRDKHEHTKDRKVRAMFHSGIFHWKYREIRDQFIKDIHTLSFSKVTKKYKGQIPFCTLKTWKDKGYFDSWIKEAKLD